MENFRFLTEVRDAVLTILIGNLLRFFSVLGKISTIEDRLFLIGVFLSKELENNFFFKDFLQILIASSSN